MRIHDERGGVFDYTEVLTQKPAKYIILRHDVEFSPKRAFDLAKVEYELGLRSTYFFQVTNNAYNMLSMKNMDLCREIADMGHRIGLHFHLNGMTDLKQLTGRIEYEADLLSHYFGHAIDRFSFHRPSALVLENNVKVAGLINAYAPQFFTYYRETNY